MEEITIGREDCLIPKDKEELDSLFRPMAEEFGEKLTPYFCFEGNSGKTMDWLYMLIKSVGYGRVAIPSYVMAPNADHCDTIYVNIKKPRANFLVANCLSLYTILFLTQQLGPYLLHMMLGLNRLSMLTTLKGLSLPTLLVDLMSTNLIPFRLYNSQEYLSEQIKCK